MSGNSQPIEIFKSGRHITAAGDTLDFSEAQLKACADAYDPAVHEAPIVIGHPSDNGPAYGWVAGLSLQSGKLSATPSQVDPAFAEMVGAGRFKKVSASFYLPTSPSNPVPGTLYLRHIGFLGAQPPAVKGLRDASFAEKEEGIAEFADWDDLQNASLWRRMREWLIGKFGQDVADQVVPGYAVDALQQSAMAPDSELPNDAAPAFTETTPPTPKDRQMTVKDAAAQAVDFAERDRSLGVREAALKKKEDDALQADWASFCDGLVKGGRLSPGQRTQVLGMVTSISPTTTVVEFGEKGEKTEKPALDVFRAFLESLPKQVEFREVAKGGGEARQLDTEDATAISRAAVEFQEAESKAGRVVSTVQAVSHVVAHHEGAKQ